jgi:hypothetical protein
MSKAVEWGITGICVEAAFLAATQKQLVEIERTLVTKSD